MEPSPPRDAVWTAVGRARGRRRMLLIATCAALIAASIADAATGYDGPGPFIHPVFVFVSAVAAVARAPRPRSAAPIESIQR